MSKKHFVAIVLAAGKGSRMQSDVPKQYMSIQGKPILYYSLKAFQESEVEEIILVVGASEKESCQKNIVEHYGFTKVTAIVSGGEQRYQSVYNALQLLRQRGKKSCDYVMIHDAARPLVSKRILRDVMNQVVMKDAVVVGVVSKDTIKIVDQENRVVTTPIRSNTYSIQTPQAFAFQLVMDAYDTVIEQNVAGITDDAMVVEYATSQKIQVIEGDYANIKVTTAEDITVIEMLLNKINNEKEREV